MDISTLTDLEIEEQIELFQDRIETISEYISENEDNTVRHVLISQRDSYRYTLKLLYEEKRNRFSKKVLLANKTEDISVLIEYENYEYVKIGNQLWMTANLNVSQFNNGDSIKEAKSNEDWINAGKNFEPAWCYYYNDPSNSKYGKLYNLFITIKQ